MRHRILAAIALALTAATANAALLGRAPLTPGGTDYQAYYDTALNITWLADANLAASNTFGVSGIHPAGYMNWDIAQSWITAVNSANYLGLNNWRLPNIVDTGTSGCDFAYSGTDCGLNVDLTTGEAAHLYYGTLGNLGYYNTSGVGPQPGSGLTNPGPFSNFQPAPYWSGTTYAPDSSWAWNFDFDLGWQSYILKSFGYYAWPVSPGDQLAPVPVPAAVWLFGGALVALGVLKRKKATA